MLEEFKHAFQRYNNGHVQLIIINVAIFLFLGVIKVVSDISGFPGVFEAIYTQVSLPSPITEFLTKPWTLITYAFMHSMDDILHIFFNMLFFYWFGRLFVEYLGSDKLIAVYVLGALAGGLLYLLVYNLIPYYQIRISTMVGASAAVYAVAVAAATLLPDYTFFLMFVGPVKIKYIVAFYIVLSFLGTIGQNAGGNIAHLGGALIGFLYIKQLQSGLNLGAWVTATLSWIKSLFAPKQNVKVSYRSPKQTPSPRSSKPANVSQDELDSILDKISDGGYESLTKEEKEKLFNASKK